MRALRLDRVAASTALALILALPGSLATANQDGVKTLSDTAIEAQFPLPEEAGVPPLTQADIERQFPLPEEAGVPPLTKADIEPTARTTTATAPATDATPAAPAAAETAAAPATAPAASPASAQAAAPAAPAPAGSEPSTTSSIGAPPAATSVTAAPAMSDDALLSAIPVPEAANVPPVTINDIGKLPLSLADAAIAAKLKDEFSSKAFERLVTQKREREAIEAFYAARDFAPLWSENGAVAARTKAVAARLKAADADGLDAADYDAPNLAALGGKDAAAAAEAELKYTATVLTYTRHAQAGRVNSSRISPNIDFSPVGPEPDDVLGKLTAAKDAGNDIAKVLDGYHPPHDGYKRLRAKLAELRQRDGGPDVVQIPAGQLLKVMQRPMEDPRVPLLRQRLGLAGDASDLTYTRELADAVRAFQKEKKIAVTGVVGPGTITALNGRSKSRDLNTIVSNMERWRWLPRDLGTNHVLVNVPDFSLKVVRNKAVVWRTKIVVGKAGTPSPSFSAKIETIQVNPTWHVPQSIIYGEYLPALEQDPSVLARMGLVMERKADGSIAIRQPPGERNALGRIKFNFPNKFQVYLHDTPDKRLFAHDRRAYSHGCMRVEDPTMFGEVLASIAMPQENLTAAKFQRMFGSGEQWMRFKSSVPVHLIYMNAYVDEAGQLVVREDIYGYDGRVQSALRGQYVAVNERSQRSGGTAAARSSTSAASARQQGQRDRRQMVQEQPRNFFFPFFR